MNFGEDFTARVDIENKTESIRTLETIITCTSLYYNGVPAHRIKVTFVFCSCLLSVLVGFEHMLAHKYKDSLLEILTTKIKTTIAKNTFTSFQGGKGPVQRQRARKRHCQSRGEKKCLENGINGAKDSDNKKVSKIIF